MSDDKVWVICVPVGIEEPVQGSVMIDASCGHTVWISAATMEVMLEQKGTPICVPCAFKKLGPEKIVEMARYDKRQLDEMPEEEVRSWVKQNFKEANED